MKKYRVVALVGREPGFRVLSNVLFSHPQLEIVSVFTHRLLTKKEGGKERPEYQDFQEVCEQYGTPLITMERLEAKEHLAARFPTDPVDLLFVLSWRTIVPSTVLGKLRCGGINIHRGALPKYAGNYPVERAIEAGEERVAITALDLAEELDAGTQLVTAWLEIAPKPAELTAAEYAEIIKRRLLPFYEPVARMAIDLRIAAIEMENAAR